MMDWNLYEWRVPVYRGALLDYCWMSEEDRASSSWADMAAIELGVEYLQESGSLQKLFSRTVHTRIVSRPRTKPFALQISDLPFVPFAKFICMSIECTLGLVQSLLG